MPAYYNEFDAEKVQWLRELIRRRVVANGDVDTRSIKEVEAKDLAGYAQCHFFAGIGVWSYALRLAGWPDDRPVWTGSCPCPSFSAAGKGGGFNDPRHLWPDWARLIRECKPATLFGEQADDAIGYGWLDLVQTDLERENYAVGKAVLGACSVGAPHIRQRLYFLAHAQAAEAVARPSEIPARAGTHDADRSGIGGDAGRMEYADSERCREARGASGGSGERGERASGGLADSANARRPTEGKYGSGQSLIPARPEQHGGDGLMADANGRGFAMRWFGKAQPNSEQLREQYVNGFWRDADWILRKRWNRGDWEWCPVEPGSFPLASGASARVLRLRGYGDAIVPQVAAAFIEASVEAHSDAPL